MAKLCPSLMCADFSHLAQEIQDLEAAGADMFHIDIMDGNFVPNFSMGIEDVKAVKKIATIPFDAHLAITNPDVYIEKFAQLGCQIIYIHAETTQHLHRSLMKIRETGVKVGVALNPGTPIYVLEDVLSLVDVILIMSVNTGFAGQKFIPEAYNRAKRLFSMIHEKNYQTKLAIDGAINEDVITVLKHEIEYFILGTAGLFRNDRTYKQSINILKTSAG